MFQKQSDLIHSLDGSHRMFGEGAGIIGCRLDGIVAFELAFRLELVVQTAPNHKLQQQPEQKDGEFRTEP